MRLAAASLLLLFPLSSDTPAQKPAGAGETETLHYNVNWPSGLSLGEATLTSRKTDEGWHFSMQLDASVPGFAVLDKFDSSATPERCSVEFRKQTAHGKKKTSETVTFNSARGTVSRQTQNGGKSEFAVSPCAKDALAFLFFTRQELANGRVPAPQAVIWGASYQVRLEYLGTRQFTHDGKRADADRIQATLKGPASEHTVEMLFARDAARTPLLIRVPLPLGSFSMELAR